MPLSLWRLCACGGGSRGRNAPAAQAPLAAGGEPSPAQAREDGFAAESASLTASVREEEEAARHAPEAGEPAAECEQQGSGLRGGGGAKGGQKGWDVEACAAQLSCQ